MGARALELVAHRHAAAARVAQMPSTPSATDPDVRRWLELRAACEELTIHERTAAYGELFARHTCWLPTCPWGQGVELPEEFRAPPDDAPELVAYCDGSGTQAHLPCGCGVVVVDQGEVVLEASRALGLGTNNHAEISAARVALAVTDTPEWRTRPLVVRTDSMYTIGALTAPRAPAPERPNARLIAATRKLLAGRVVRFEHVRGHSGEVGNERADELAGLARRRQLAPVAHALGAA